MLTDRTRKIVQAALVALFVAWLSIGSWYFSQASQAPPNPGAQPGWLAWLTDRAACVRASSNEIAHGRRRLEWGACSAQNRRVLTRLLQANGVGYGKAP